MYLLVLALVACLGSSVNPATVELLERDLNYLEHNISKINVLKGQMTAAYTRGELLHVMQQLSTEKALCRGRVLHYNEARPMIPTANPERFPKDIDPRICEESDGTLYERGSTASE